MEFLFFEKFKKENKQRRLVSGSAGERFMTCKH